MKYLYLAFWVNLILCSAQTENLNNAILPGARCIFKRNVRFPFYRTKKRREHKLRNDHFNSYAYDLAQKQNHARYLDAEPYYLNAIPKFQHDYDFYEFPRDQGLYRRHSYNSRPVNNYGYSANNPLVQDQEDVSNDEMLFMPMTYLQNTILGLFLALTLFLVVVLGIQYRTSTYKKSGMLKRMADKKKKQQTQTTSNNLESRGILVASNEAFDKAGFLKKVMNGKKERPTNIRFASQSKRVEDKLIDMLKEKKTELKKAPKSILKPTMPSVPTVRFKSVINDDPLLFMHCQRNPNKHQDKIPLY